MPAPELITLRLSADAMKLEVSFTRQALHVARTELVHALIAQCQLLKLEFSPTRQYLDLLLAKFTPFTWITLLKGTEPTAPVDGRVEVVVPVQVAGARASTHPRKCVVRAGAILARRQPGISGRPGTDLLGREVPARAPLEPKLPQSINTEISEDGMELLSVCDGEAVLRNLAIEVIPLLLHEGDVPAGTTFISEVLPVYIRGTVLEGAFVQAEGDVFIDGDVVEAQVLSTASTVTVAGSIGGTRQRTSTIRAARDVTFEQARLAHVHAGTDIHVLGCAWQCSLQGHGNIYLRDTVEEALQDVLIEIAGGVFPVFDRAASQVEGARERQYVRLGCHIPAEIAVHTGPPLSFRRCTVVDLSAGGAKCVYADPRRQPSAGSFVQLKAVLPGTRGQFIVLARVVRLVAPGVLGLSFLQMTHRDHGRLTTYCQQEVLKRSTVVLTSPEQRGRVL